MRPCHALHGAGRGYKNASGNLGTRVRVGIQGRRARVKCCRATMARLAWSHFSCARRKVRRAVIPTASRARVRSGVHGQRGRTLPARVSCARRGGYLGGDDSGQQALQLRVPGLEGQGGVQLAPRLCEQCEGVSVCVWWGTP